MELRKDYNLIAAALLKARPQKQLAFAETTQWNFTVKVIAEALANDNTGFKCERFVEACGSLWS
jgi:hypothetical protein